MANQHDSTWQMHAPETFFQGLYATTIGPGPTLSITVDANSSGRYAWLLPSAEGATSIKDWPISEWIPLTPNATTNIVPGSLPAKIRVECQTGTLVLKSTCP
jgi:hypothetical protein